MTRQRWAKLVWFVTAAWVLVLLLSLHYGWLNRFFFDTSHAHVQGIDYFPVPRAWRNLLDGRSAFDTFSSNYGPYATWFLYHPFAALLLGPFTTAMSPWAGYRVWTAISFLLLSTSAWLITLRGRDPLRQALAALLMFGFPAFLMLYVGNAQAVLVLAIVLVVTSVDAMREYGCNRNAEAMLLTGLLLSLFTKPAVLAMLPLLLLLPETRRSALRALAIYAFVSILCLVVPGINPEPIAWAQRWFLLRHPATVRQTMNVYTNGMTVTAPMKDNFVHWLVLTSLAEFRLPHIDVYSLPVFLDGWLGVRTPAALYRVPAILVLELTALVALMRDNRDRLEAALMTLMASSLLLFLSYGIVWEYHYTLVSPVAALLLARHRPRAFEWCIIGLAVLVWLPSVFFLLNLQTLATPGLTLLRSTRVIPAALIFSLLLIRAAAFAVRSPAGLRFLPNRSAHALPL